MKEVRLLIIMENGDYLMEKPIGIVNGSKLAYFYAEV